MRSLIVLAVSSIAFTLLLLAGKAGAAPEDSIPGVVPEVLPIKPVEIGQSEDELLRLLKKRYNAVAAELRDLYALYKGGRAPLANVCQAIEKFAHAGSELAETPAARVSKLESARDAARAVETIAQEKELDGLEPRHALEHARACRLDIEIQLLRAREAAKAAREPK